MILTHSRTGVCVNTDTGEVFKVTDEPKVETTPEAGPPAMDPVTIALEARVAELENVVHAIAPYSRNAEHNVVVAWVQKMGARIKAAIEGV